MNRKEQAFAAGWSAYEAGLVKSDGPDAGLTGASWFHGWHKGYAAAAAGQT